MQVKMTTAEMRQAFEAAQAMSQRRFPAKLSYWFSRLVSKLKDDYNTSEDTRLALAKEFGTLDEASQQYRMEGEAAQEFSNVYNGILNTEIGLDLPSISFTEFGSCEIEPAVLTALDKLITE